MTVWNIYDIAALMQNQHSKKSILLQFCFCTFKIVFIDYDQNDSLGWNS